MIIRYLVLLSVEPISDQKGDCHLCEMTVTFFVQISEVFLT